MIRAVMNEVSRSGASAQIQVTFIDESGNGIARYSIVDNSGMPLLEGDLECPRMYVAGPIDVASDRFPLTARSAECGASGSDSGPEGYTDETVLEFRFGIPFDPENNPCSIPDYTREEAGTPCSDGRQAVFDIAAEIEALCDEYNRQREDYLHHIARKDAYVAAASVLLVAAAACLFVSTIVPWPASLILQIAAAALFVAALVTGSLAAYHAQEANRARRAMEETEALLEDARRRYRDAVEAAIRDCCGYIPSGMELDPPGC